MFKNALVSVSDKTGLIDFITPLARQGMRVVSTGGTARYLKQAGVNVVEVSEQTGFSEVMAGRVKSLHPRIHIPLLARSDHPEDQKALQSEKLEPFDLLVCNLYPFEKEPGIEQIDVGGPSMLRAGAKNFEQVTVLCDPNDYQKILVTGKRPDQKTRKQLAAKVFSHLANYNSCIARWMTNASDSKVDDLHITARFFKKLRYGENPSQEATWFQIDETGLHQSKCLQGKPLSFNNIRDLESAVLTLRQFKQKACSVAVKHNNPCGVACADTLELAVQRTLKADPVSVFGGVLALNKEVSETTANQLCSLFLEAVIAPAYTAEALKIFQSKKNLRLVEWPTLMNPSVNPFKVYSVEGGLLSQGNHPSILSWDESWQVIGQTPSEDIKSDLLMAWQVCSQLKSNAIAIVKDLQTVGLGMGQVSRISAVEGAVKNWKQFHSNIKAPVLASDGFFPFPDSIETACQAGVKWIIQPGGSIRDREVITKAKDLSVNMVLTGSRCFLH